MDCVARRLGCASVDLPIIHLGIPVGQNMTHIFSWSPILHHFWSSLSVWKAKNLSYEGHLTLVKSILGSLGSYLMLVFLTPVSIIKSLEALQAIFFGGAGLDERRCIGLVRIRSLLLEEKVV